MSGIRVLSILVLLTTLASLANAAEPGKDTDTRSTPASIPFKLYQGYVVVVQGRIGDQKLNLMVDTGARPSVIDTGMAHKLGIAGEELAMSLPNKNVRIQRAELPLLQVGPLRKTRHSIIVADLTHLKAQLRIQLHGMIGLDVLDASSFTIDYQRKQIVFGLPESATWVPYDTDPPFVIVNLQAGGRDLRMLVDTGTPGLMLFKGCMEKRFGKMKSLGRQEMRNMAGWMHIDRVEMERVCMGDCSFGTMPANLAEDQADWGATFDGLVGPAALGIKQLSFDFKQRRLGWTR